MRTRTLILLFVIIILPVAVLAWSGIRAAERERNQLAQQFEDLIDQRLVDADGMVQTFFERLKTRVGPVTSTRNFTEDDLRNLGRTTPEVAQLFVLDNEGQLVYPRPDGRLTNGEYKFLVAAGRLFSEQDLPVNPPPRRASRDSGQRDTKASAGDEDVLRSNPGQGVADSSLANSMGSWSVAGSGDGVVRWKAWYWDRGLQLILWRQHSDGTVVGASLDRSRWMADLISRLPDTDAQTDNTDATQSVRPLLQLVDEAGDLVYQWGTAVDPESFIVAGERLCSGPASSWRLVCLIAPGTALSGRSSGSPAVLLGFGAVAVSLLGCLALFFRDYMRDMRRAENQVSFVNQVSHELKTPLTNIRMYGELLEQDFSLLTEAESDSEADRVDARPDAALRDRMQKRLDVILSESGRLTGLISNVLTFARSERQETVPKFNPVEIPLLLNQLVSCFQPVTDAAGVLLQLDCPKSLRFSCDAAFVEQIMSNLLNNVCKYAAHSGAVRVSVTRIGSERLQIDVIDQGPGIPRHERERIFEAFARSLDGISDVAGTGIGLTISRRLARSHGGDVTLEETEIGCHFRVILSGTEVT